MTTTRLFAAGEIDSKAATTTQTDKSSLIKDAMFVYAGKFESMDGPVTVTEKHIQKLHDNFNAKLAAISGEPEAKDLPPLQLDHSASAHDTVGRVVGPLRLGTFNGKMALFGLVKVIGKENVEKVDDGRWTNLSIGADLDEGKLNELTVTPFSAAEHATFLSKQRGSKLAAKKENVKEGEILGHKFSVVCMTPDDTKERAYFLVEGVEGLTEKFEDAPTAMQMAQEHIRRKAKGTPTKMSGGTVDKEKMKKHLMEKEKLSEKEADEKLAAMSAEDGEKLSAEVDEKEKKMAADEEEKKKTEMSKRKEDFAKLTSGFRAKATESRLAARQMSLKNRTSRLRAQAKMTPAEVKGIDFARLAAKSEEAVEMFFEAIEKREPVILTGTIGTQKADNLAKLQKAKAQEALQAETLANMPFTSAALKGAKLSNAEDMPNGGGGGGGPAKEGQGPTPAGESLPGTSLSKGHMEEMCAHLEKAMAAHESGNAGEAQEHLKMCHDKMKAHMAYMSDGGTAEHEIPMHEDAEEKMAALSKASKAMETQFEEMVAMVAPILGMEA